MSGYYADKLASLGDIFGSVNLTLGEDWLQVEGRRYPIVDDVIVLLDDAEYPPALRDRLGMSPAEGVPGKEIFAEDIQSTFGEEWKVFHEILPGHKQEFRNYFDLIDVEGLSELRVCDLGCGIGRWSSFLKDKCRELVLVDFSEAIFVARRNLQDCPRALFFMGNLKSLPFRADFADFLFCLGVLHHLPTNALVELRHLSKYARSILAYLYYSLDNRPLYFRWLLGIVTPVRLMAAQVRSPSFRAAFTWLAARFIYVPMIWLGHLLLPLGLSRFVPLHSGYAGSTVGRIQQDVYDRFFTRIEQRFSRKEIAGLTDTYAEVVISDHGPYWHFLCLKQGHSQVQLDGGGSDLLESAGIQAPVTTPASIMQIQRWRWLLAVIGLGLLVSLIVATNVPTRLSAEDVAVFENDLDLRNLPRPLTFEDEIQVIRMIQARVFAKAPFGNPIPEYEPREPSDLMRNGRGWCYDRARTLEKAFTYMGMRNRHVFLLYRKDLSLFETMIRRGHPSHAVTEVMTSRGWLYVDSNEPWIAVTPEGEPHGAGGIWKHFDEFENPPAYVRGPWWAIRGLYSRKGAFFAPYLPAPQGNWKDLLEWVFGEYLFGT